MCCFTCFETVQSWNVNSWTLLYPLPLFLISLFCLYLHFCVLLSESLSVKTFMYSMWSGQVKGSCYDEPFRCACVCMCARVCMNLPVTVCLYVTHLCLTGNHTAAGWEPKEKGVWKEKNKAEVVYYKALHSHTTISWRRETGKIWRGMCSIQATLP